jgi:hypothetical protein
LFERRTNCGQAAMGLQPVITTATNSHWARVVGYGPFSLCVIHKDGLCPSSGDIKRLKMIPYVC